MNDPVYLKKLEQASGIMDELALDAWVIFVRETAMNPDPVTELLWDLAVVWPAAFVITADGQRIATAVVHDAPTLEASGLFTEIVPFDKVPEETLPAILKRLDPATIALNYSEENVAADGLSHGLWLRLDKMAGELGMADRFCPAEQLIGLLRQRKLPIELERMTEAARVAETIFDGCTDLLRAKGAGLTETTIAAHYHNRLTELGLTTSWDWHMCPNVNAGPNTGRGHQGPRADVTYERGQIMNVDFGVKKDGYSSDQQRMWYLLDEGETAVPEHVLKPFNAVVGAIQAGFDAIKPGIPGKDVDAAARAYLVAQGYPEYLHALGHNVGHYAHDGGVAMFCPPWPSYGQRAFEPLEANQVLTLELGIWDEHGYFGLEEEVIITEDGAEWFWPPQKELVLV